MIVYDLVCARQHRFEGWFGSAEDFTRQRGDALIRCPLCDDAVIERRPSANIQVGRAPVPAPPVANVEAQALKVIRRLIAETDNVGRAFPEEARKIHYEEAPKRGIRGQATHEEADALREEGIEFMAVPPFLTSDLN
ncbi:MAG: DUF1178 family protein [Betaproteobacteria bacterium]|nr:MAG: DUF1178 family protein [Betaproteobacteria bacterium]